MAQAGKFWKPGSTKPEGPSQSSRALPSASGGNVTASVDSNTASAGGVGLKRQKDVSNLSGRLQTMRFMARATEADATAEQARLKQQRQTAAKWTTVSSARSSFSESNSAPRAPLPETQHSSSARRLVVTLDDESTVAQSGESYAREVKSGGIAAGRRSFGGANKTVEALGRAAGTGSAQVIDGVDVDDDAMASHSSAGAGAGAAGKKRGRDAESGDGISGRKDGQKRHSSGGPGGRYTRLLNNNSSRGR